MPYDHSYNFIFNYYHPNQKACIQDSFVRIAELRSLRISAQALHRLIVSNNPKTYLT